MWDQVVSYDHILGSGLVVISNGEFTYAAKADENEEAYCFVEEIPKYKDLIEGAELKYTKEIKVPWERPAFEDLMSENIIDHFRNLFWIG